MTSPRPDVACPSRCAHGTWPLDRARQCAVLALHEVWRVVKVHPPVGMSCVQQATREAHEHCRVRPSQTNRHETKRLAQLVAGQWLKALARSPVRSAGKAACTSAPYAAPAPQAERRCARARNPQSAQPARARNLAVNWGGHTSPRHLGSGPKAEAHLAAVRS